MEVERDVEGSKSEAGRKVAEWLTVAQDLDKLETLRVAVLHKKLATDAQLKAAVHSQLDAANEGLALLHQSFNSIQTIRANFGQIDALCGQCQGLIGNYDLVTQVNQARSNLYKTRTELDKMLAIPRRVKEVYGLLKDDANLLEVHRQLTGLEKSRDRALEHGGNNREQVKLIEKVFSDLTPLRAARDKRLFRLIRDTLTLAKERPAVLIKAIQIIEKEHKAAENDPDAKDKLDSEEDYRVRCKAALRASIVSRFKEVFSTAGEDVGRILAQSKVLQGDLRTVLECVAPCYPESYQVAQFYIEEYDHRLKTMFAELAQQADDLATAEILNLVKWAQLDYDPQLRAWGLTLDPLTNALLPLMHSFKDDMKKMMDQWCTRLLEADRKNDPDEIDGKYYTDAPVLLFKFINQQMDVVAPTGCRMFVGVVLDECIQVIRRYQQAVVKMLQAEWEQLSMEYILATINNNTKCADYTQELRFKVAERVEPDQISKIDFDGCAAAFEGLAATASNVVVNIIFKDLEPALDKFFQKEWYDSDFMGEIIATLVDYFENEDVKTKISFTVFVKLAEEAVDRLVLRYIAELMGRKFTADKKTISKMQQEEAALRQFCSDDASLPDNTADMLLSPLVRIRQLFEADLDMVPIYLGDFLDDHPDLTPPMLETILSKRGDLNKESRKELLDTCNRVFESKTTAQETNKRSVFARVKTKQTGLTALLGVK